MEYEDQNCGMTNRQLHKLEIQRFENGKTAGRWEGGIIGALIMGAVIAILYMN